MKADIEGVDAAIANIARLQREAAEAVRQAVVEAVDEIGQIARANAPIGETGDLKASIYSKSWPTSEGGTAGVVGTDIPYAIHVEYGTSDTAAKPFLHPAAEQVRPRFYSRLLEAVQRRIEG